MWGNQQNIALKEVDKWLREYYTSRNPKKKWFYLGGYAGTGKTTLAKHFAENIDGEVAFGAFTGKASLVMRKNGCEDARTIHSMLYIASQDQETGEVHFKFNKQSFLNDVKLIIIDECSMVDEDLATDLLKFGKPILVLGDPGQLPPVAGAGFFTSGEPDVMLTEIHRQAKDNPIIHLATQVRNGIMPKTGSYGDSAVIESMRTSDVLNADQVLVGRNATRYDMNKKIRKLLKLDLDLPVVGDRVICLKNDKDLGIFNGGIFSIEQILKPKVKSNFFFLRVDSKDEERLPVMVKVHKSFLIDDASKPDWKLLRGSQEFDYAYAITVHKSQGSQWENVFVYDESWCFRDDRWKWLYTGVTRASEKVTILKN